MESCIFVEARIVEDAADDRGEDAGGFSILAHGDDGERSGASASKNEEPKHIGGALGCNGNFI